MKNKILTLLITYSFFIVENNNYYINKEKESKQTELQYKITTNRIDKSHIVSKQSNLLTNSKNSIYSMRTGGVDKKSLSLPPLYSKMKKNSILLISATNRKGSLSLVIATYYANILKERGIKVNLLSLEELPKDFTSTALYEQQGKSDAFNKLKTLIEQSQRMIWIVPEYNCSFPGVFKAFIDGLPLNNKKNILKGKKVAFVGVSRGLGGCRSGLDHLTIIGNYLDMQVLPKKIYLSGIKEINLEHIKKEFPHYLELIDRQVDNFLIWSES